MPVPRRRARSSAARRGRYGLCTPFIYLRTVCVTGSLPNVCSLVFRKERERAICWLQGVLLLFYSGAARFDLIVA